VIWDVVVSVVTVDAVVVELVMVVVDGETASRVCFCWTTSPLPALQLCALAGAMVYEVTPLGLPGLLPPAAGYWKDVGLRTVTVNVPV